MPFPVFNFRRYEVKTWQCQCNLEYHPVKMSESGNLYVNNTLVHKQSPHYTEDYGRPITPTPENIYEMNLWNCFMNE